MNARVEIRAATLADAPALSALAQTTFAVAFGHSMSAPDLAHHLRANLSRERVAAMFGEDTFLLADANVRVVGFAQFGAAPAGEFGATERDAELRRLYVLADFQNRGIGASLMRAALAHPQLHDAERVFLDVWERNLAAQRFYARFGFVVVGARAFGVASGAATSDDLVMMRRR